MGQAEGWHDVLHDRQIVPLHHFPGDDAVNPADYTAAVYTWYSEKLSMFQAGAEACGLELDQANLERGRRVLAASCWLDEYLDQPSPRRRERVSLFKTAIQSLRLGRSGGWSQGIETNDPELAPRPELRTAVRLMETATAADAGFHPDLRRRSLLRAELIGNAALNKGTITDPRHYVQQLRQESDATASIMAEAFLDRPPTSAAELQWARVMRKCIRSVVLIDCGLDLPGDVAQGRAAVPPLLRNRLRLAAYGLHEVVAGGAPHDGAGASKDPDSNSRQSSRPRGPHSDLSILLRMGWQHHRLSQARLNEPLTAVRAPALPLPRS